MTPRPELATKSVYEGLPRHQADATVTVTLSKSRFPRGEIVIGRTYQLPDGTRETSEPTRVYLEEQISPAVRNLWEALFDETATAAQAAPKTLSIQLQIPDLSATWRCRLRALAEIAAYEFGATLKGTAPYLRTLA